MADDPNPNPNTPPQQPSPPHSNQNTDSGWVAMVVIGAILMGLVSLGVIPVSCAKYLPKIGEQYKHYCSDCEGTGTVKRSCAACQGRGYFAGRLCPQCQGSGKLSAPCTFCGGSGRIPTK